MVSKKQYQVIIDPLKLQYYNIPLMDVVNKIKSGNNDVGGRIVAVGDHVTKFKVGDLAAVGCMVDSCGICDHCKEGLEQYCDAGNTGTYNSPDKYLGTQTLVVILKVLL